jgi:mannose-6-phosphate isomerase-like protein (cupin superfamily)
MNRLERKRPQIDPTKIRKHSQIVAEKQDPFLILGDRTQTDYGFTVSGVTYKSFETFHMVLMPNTTTPAWLHAKKARIYRVVSGSGYFQQFTEGNTVPTGTKPLAPGDEILVEPGMIHRLTSGVLKMEIYVTQDGKYGTHLEEILPTETVAAVPAEDLRPVTDAEKHTALGITPRRRNRAAEQIAALRGERANPDRSAQNAERGDQFLRGTASTGVNARPVLDLSEEGAG